MRKNSQNTSTLIASVLLLSAFALSGCTGAVVGVGTAAVAASTTEKGFSTSVSDGVIFAKLKDRFIQVNASLLTSIDVTVNEGAVLFTGTVKTPEDKIKGVREVVNELQVIDNSSIKDIAKDLAATATLRGKMIADEDISSLNFSIDVVNGIVYLSGVASTPEELNKVVNHAKNLRFAQEVVNYIILSKDQRE
jgi:osmotically-inducible protein OsmY